MTVSISSVIAEAKSALKGKWIMAIIAALALLFSLLIIQNIAYLFSLALGNIASTVIMYILMLVLSCPLLLGVLRYYWRIFGGADETPVAVFYYFSEIKLFLKSLRFWFMLLLRIALFAAVFYLPTIAVYVISAPEFYRFIDIAIPIWSQNLSAILNFFSSISFALVVVSTIKFYLSPILVIADDKMDLEEAFHMSSVISKTSITDFIFLVISLLGWILISILFLPLLFTLPYFFMCYTVHSFYSIKDYNEKIKRLNEESFPSFIAGV